MKFLRLLVLLCLLPVACGFAKKPHSDRYVKIANHQTAMWRAYYYNDLETYAKEMQLTYEVMFNIKDATKAREAMAIAVQAFAALPKHTRYDLLQRVVLPRIIRAFEAIKAESNMEFDVVETSQALLDLWRVRRHGQLKGIDSLVPYMANYLSKLWGKSPEFYHHAAYYMLAALDCRHFCKHRQGQYTEADWAYIKTALTNHYEALDAIQNEARPSTR